MPVIPQELLRRPVVVKPEWQERSLIFRHPSGKIECVDCWTYGTLAVHLSLPGNPDWAPAVVTHAPTKLAILKLDDVDDALAAAEHLWDTCKDAFTTVDRVVDKSRVPPSTLEWIANCNKQRKFVR